MQVIQETSLVELFCYVRELALEDDPQRRRPRRKCHLYDELPQKMLHSCTDGVLSRTILLR